MFPNLFTIDDNLLFSKSSNIYAHICKVDDINETEIGLKKKGKKEKQMRSIGGIMKIARIV